MNPISASTTVTTAGTVRYLGRYPVKSMRGEALPSSTIEVRGLTGDRRWAVVDAHTGAALSGKRHPELLHCHAMCNVPDAVTVQLPDGGMAHSDDPDTAPRLSAFFRRPVELAHAGNRRVVNEFGAPFRDETDPTRGARLVTGLRGTFADGAPLHLVTAAALRALEDVPAAESGHPGRYRPNIIVDSTQDNGRLLEGRMRLGSAEIELTGPCPRCVMVNADQQGIPRAPDLLRRIAQEHQGEVGVYAKVLRPGTVSVGDQLIALRTAP